MAEKNPMQIADLPPALTELTDTEAESVTGGSPTLPLPPPSLSSRRLNSSFDRVALNPQPEPPGIVFTLPTLGL